jgi:hypothetical protein
MKAFLIYLIFTMTLQPLEANAQVTPLPSPQQFDSLLKTCAEGTRIEISDKLRGSLTSTYSQNKQSIESARFSSSVASIFLEKVPDVEKLKVFQIYVSCIVRILSGEENFNEPQAVIELTPTPIVTGGRPYSLKAKKDFCQRLPDHCLRPFCSRHRRRIRR